MTTHSPINEVLRGGADGVAGLARRLGPITYRAIGSLVAYDKNARHHPEQQLVKLASSIREFGFTLPVLIDVDDVIIAGHARVVAARHVGLEEVPVLVAAGWSKAQVRAYRLADNRLAELASWDAAILATELSALIELDEVPIDLLGWEAAEIDLILGARDKEQETARDPADVVPERSSATVTRRGDLWQLGQHRLLCAPAVDEEAWSQLMDGAVAAMGFVDLAPNIAAVTTSGAMSSVEVTAFVIKSLGNVAGRVREGGVIFIATNWQHLRELFGVLDASGLELLDLCVWTNANGPINDLYSSQHQLILVTKKLTALLTSSTMGDKRRQQRSNVWTHAAANGDRADELARMPVALIADAIGDVTRRSDIIIDPFAGVATTVLAAERMGRTAFGLESEARLIDAAVQRWQALTGAHAVLAQTGETFAAVAEQRGGEDAGDLTDEDDATAETHD